jgi:predicted amidohydrolase
MTDNTNPAIENIHEDGTYPSVELRKETIMATVVQTRVGSIDPDHIERDVRTNLDYMLECIDIAQGFGPPSDLLLFHEFPVTGFSELAKDKHYELARQIPGPETEEIGKKAKKYNCYIVFGTYAKDPAWPGHILHLMVLIGPDGNVVAKHWKQRNVRGMWPGSELYSTAIYDVYDQFVEMYGLDAVIPIAQTDIGNIAMSAVQFEPELFRCMAMKGAEIICRVATGGFEFEDMRLTSYHNSLYTMIANNSISTQERHRGYFEEEAYGGPGRSAIFGPRGVTLAEAGAFETRRMAMIPIGAFREKHRIPDVHMQLYKPVFDAYRTRYDHGLYSEQVPASKVEAFRFFLKNSRWTHFW